MAASDAYADIDIRGARIDELGCRVDAQADFGMARRKAMQPVHQPAGGQNRCDRNGQHGLVAMMRHGDCFRQHRKALAEPAENRCARLGDDHALGRAFEKRAPKLRFRLDDLLADGADGDAEFFGRRLQRAEAGDRFQRAQSVQMYRRKVSHVDYL